MHKVWDLFTIPPFAFVVSLWMLWLCLDICNYRSFLQLTTANLMPAEVSILRKCLIGISLPSKNKAEFTLCLI
jgi:hypothetical protein